MLKIADTANHALWSLGENEDALVLVRSSWSCEPQPEHSKFFHGDQVHTFRAYWRDYESEFPNDSLDSILGKLWELYS